VEFDAVLVAAGTTPTNDIKLFVLLQEAFRHCKALGAWGDGTAVLSGAGIVLDGPGVLVADSVGKAFTQNLVAALGLHRAWDRAIAVMASAVPPAA
jgi:catalase